MSLTRGRGRGLLAALTACSLLTTALPFTVGAEDGIPAGSGAVVTTGASLLVRTAPGWDSGVSYEIADGSAVTVLDAAQAAVDGSLWYPVDGGFVPVDAVSSVAPAETGFAYFQTVDPAAVPLETGEGWIDPNTGEWVDPNAQQVATDAWVDPATQQAATDEWVEPAVEQVASDGGWIDPNTGEWVDPNAQPVATDAWVDPATQQVAVEGWIDPNTGEWVDAATQQVATDAWVDPATQTAATDGWIDPNTGEWVDPATQTVSTDGWVDPATQTATTTGWIDPNTGEWVDPAAQQVAVEGWIDPNTGEWVDPNAQVVSLAQEAVTDGTLDPAAEQLVDPASETWQDPAAVTDPAADALTDAGASPEVWDPTAAVAETTDTPVADQTEWVEPAPVETGVSGDGWSDPIGTAYIAGTNGDGVACRASAERGSEKLAVLGEGEAVEVRGEAVGEWQPVNCAGIGGYVNTSFISWEPVASQQGQGKRNRSRSVGNGGVETASGDGQSMANFAMQYVGYPYVYAGEGPYAFDCSGFTKFVAQNTLGIDITHDMFTQIGMGQSVDQGSLQAGDLVFFANTFRPGLSHTGVYVGGGQFVHAENESTGVTVSELSSDYYSSRWYGATRLG